MDTLPLISVVIPTFNGQDRIGNALLSVVGQTYKNIEIIVVDDGSTDNTQKILDDIAQKGVKIKIIKNKENIGFVKSLNKGINEASGKYIARLDDDDIWYDAKKLQKQVEFLENKKDYVLVGGGIIIESAGEKKEIIRYLFPEKDQDIRKSILAYNLFAHSAVVFLKRAFVQCGGYDQEFGFFADMDLWLKLGAIGKFYNFKEYFTVYLDKETGFKKYSSRDLQIRRKLMLRIKMKYKYRKIYPGFLKSVVLCACSYLYSFLPFKEKIKPILFSVRTKILGTPYKYEK